MKADGCVDPRERSQGKNAVGADIDEMETWRLGWRIWLCFCEGIIVMIVELPRFARLLIVHQACSNNDDQNTLGLWGGKSLCSHKRLDFGPNPGYKL